MPAWGAWLSPLPQPASQPQASRPADPEPACSAQTSLLDASFLHVALSPSPWRFPKLALGTSFQKTSRQLPDPPAPLAFPGTSAPSRTGRAVGAAQESSHISTPLLFRLHILPVLSSTPRSLHDSGSPLLGFILPKTLGLWRVQTSLSNILRLISS